MAAGTVKWTSKLGMVWVMIGVMVFAGAVLGALVERTTPIVAKQERLARHAKILDAFGIAYGGPDEIEKTYESLVRVEEVGGHEIFRHEEGGELKGVAFEIAGSGFWAKIRAVLAVEPDMETVINMRVIEQAETPGLGARITEDWFQNQFQGKKIQPHLTVTRYRTPENEFEVEGISGATQTSQAFERLLNASVSDVLTALHDAEKKG